MIRKSLHILRCGGFVFPVWNVQVASSVPPQARFRAQVLMRRSGAGRAFKELIIPIEHPHKVAIRDVSSDLFARAYTNRSRLMRLINCFNFHS